MNSARAFIFSAFLVIFSLLSFVTPTFAQTPPTNTNPNVPNNLHTWTQNVLIEVMSSLTCQIVGIDSINPKDKCLGVDQKTGKIGFVENGGGAIAVMGSLITMTITPPIHTVDYVNYLAGNFGITKPAYAAPGLGFNGLNPLLSLWTQFRNIAYLLFVIVFIAIGFAIMLRVHIDPRTVMTVENQIPKIIIALILVTFSFAIVGFLIDLMYVLIYLAIGVFSNISPDIKNAAEFQNIWGLNPLEIANNIPVHGGGGTGIFGIATNASAAVGEIVGSLFSGLSNILVVGFIFDGIIKILGTLIIGVAVLFALFRLWFTLLEAYVFLILDVIFAPFWIIAGLLPGGNLSFVSWLRETGGELLAFPAAIVMFLLATVLMNLNYIPDAKATNLFVPPLIGNPNGNQLASLAGLGIILMTPTVVNMMKGWLKAPKFDISAISQAVGVGAAYPASVAKGVGGTIQASKEYRVKEIDKTTGAAKYGEAGPLRALLGRFTGRGG